jgi:acyl carrier protein
MPEPSNPPETQSVLNELSVILTAILEKEDLAQVDMAGLSVTTPLLSLPIDSLKLVELMTCVEDRYRIYIPEESAYAFATLGELVSFVQGRVVAKAARQQR